MTPLPPSIHLQCDGAVARLRIDHAQRRNAFTRAMWRSVPGLVEQALARRPRAVVVESAVPASVASLLPAESDAEPAAKGAPKGKRRGSNDSTEQARLF